MRFWLYQAVLMPAPQRAAPLQLEARFTTEALRLARCPRAPPCSFVWS